MFNLWELLSIGLTLLASLLDKAKAGGASQEVVDGIQAALDKLREVHGTPVTKAQLESLRG